MNDTTRTESIARTVAVVTRYAVDLDHAVEVLVAEFGFDQVFQALAAMEEPVAHQALFACLLVEAPTARTIDLTDPS